MSRQRTKPDMRARKERRERALARGELRVLSECRESSAGPTSFAVKVTDPHLRALIDEAVANRLRSGLVLGSSSMMRPGTAEPWQWAPIFWIECACMETLCRG